MEKAEASENKKVIFKGDEVKPEQAKTKTPKIINHSFCSLASSPEFFKESV